VGSHYHFFKSIFLKFFRKTQLIVGKKLFRNTKKDCQVHFDSFHNFSFENFQTAAEPFVFLNMCEKLLLDTVSKFSGTWLTKFFFLVRKKSSYKLVYTQTSVIKYLVFNKLLQTTFSKCTIPSSSVFSSTVYAFT
jgi:hypothetical protein